MYFTNIDKMVRITRYRDTLQFKFAIPTLDLLVHLPFRDTCTYFWHSSDNLAILTLIVL